MNEYDLKSINSVEHIKSKNDWIMRYMDLIKFINLLHTETLFFALASKFEDGREGLPFNPKDAVADTLLRAGQRLDSQSHEKLEANRQQMFNRNFMLVNCWTKSAEESVALWKIYTSGFHGVCIRSDISTLTTQLNGSVSNIAIDQVRYENANGMENSVAAFFRKGPEYDFEREFRAVIDLRHDEHSIKKGGEEVLSPRLMKLKEAGGLAIRVEPSKLIKEVIVHYQAPKWVFESVKELVQKFGLDKNLVTQSKLSDEFF